jgi:cytochrome P450
MVDAVDAGEIARPALPAPARPKRALSTLQLLQVGRSNTLAVCDEELFDELFVARRYGWGRLVVVSDPAGVKRVLQDNIDNYPRIDQIRRVFAFATGSGMLCAEGDLWRRHRRLINPALHHRAVVADLPNLAAWTEEAASSLAGTAPDSPINIGAFFNRLVTRLNARVFAAGDPEMEEVLRLMGNYPGQYRLRDFVHFPAWLRFLGGAGKGEDQAAAHAPLLDRLIAARAGGEEGEGQDLIGRLVRARDPQTGAGLGAAELRDEILTLASTAATPIRVLTWLWYLLALHPDAMERLQAECEAVLGGAAPNAETLGRLPYLRRLLDETMRLYPPVPVMPRLALADDIVCGHEVRRKSLVCVLPWVLHRHRKLWRDPDSFDPERFSDSESAARSRYSFVPFAIGPHVCIGAPLSLILMPVVTAVLAQRFRFRLVPGQRVEPTAWTNLRPSRPIMMTVAPRLR